MTENEKFRQGTYAVVCENSEALTPGTILKVKSGPENGIYTCTDSGGGTIAVDTSKTNLYFTESDDIKFAGMIADILDHPSRDLFFVDHRTESVTELYFDRHSKEGPGFIMNTVPLRFVRNAVRRTKGKVSSFFMEFEKVAWQKFVPAENTEDFKGCWHVFGSKPTYQGLNRETYDGLRRDGEAAYKRETFYDLFESR